MAIDVGQKRIGLAVTDPLKIFATGLDTISVSEIFSFLKEYTAKEKVDAFVVGLPRQLNCKPSDSARFVDPFVKNLARNFPSIPIERVDERFTSKIARQAMIDGGTSKTARRNKAMVDKISAVIILQSFLDQIKT